MSRRQTRSQTRRKLDKNMSRALKDIHKDAHKSDDEMLLDSDPDYDQDAPGRNPDDGQTDDDSDSAGDDNAAATMLGDASDDTDDTDPVGCDGADSDGASDVSDDEEDISALFAECMRHRSINPACANVRAGDLGDTLCGRVLSHYDAMGDHGRGTEVFSSRGAISARPLFDTEVLRKVFSYACAAGGAGLSRNEVCDFYGVLCAVEEASGGGKPIKDRFPTKSAFVQAIRNEKRRTLRYLGWRQVSHISGGQRYKIQFVDGLDVIQDVCLRASAVRFSKDDVRIFEQPQTGAAEAQAPNYSAEPVNEDGQVPGLDHTPDPNKDSRQTAAASKRYGDHDPAYTGLMNGAMYKQQLDDVKGSKLLPPGVKMLGVFVYSDATVVSGTGGKANSGPHPCVTYHE